MLSVRGLSGFLSQAVACTRQIVLPPSKTQTSPSSSRRIRRWTSTLVPAPQNGDGGYEESRLNPPPESYALTPFQDKCSILLHAGGGGHGCISFLREKFIPEGPPNGGDGGSGGSIFIQAVRGETSLHKIARKRQYKAGRGKNGQGKARGGQRGDDLLITVPVGTVIREMWRHDPMDEAEHVWYRLKHAEGDEKTKQRREKWLVYPGMPTSVFATAEFPELPPVTKSSLVMMQPPAPIRLDLDEHMETPMLLAAGASGGVGNPHFTSPDFPRPKFATKGGDGMRLLLQLELKLLADVGLVGLPNAGKSTLLRALSNSRARVGSWAFTTLQPNIGTVILDDLKGKPTAPNLTKGGNVRTRFTIADIPGLVEDAHLDKGLGLDFLRHVERSAVLAFTIDLSAGDAVQALKSLWVEVGEYDMRNDADFNTETEERHEQWRPSVSDLSFDGEGVPSFEEELPALPLPPVSSKPWFVVATKADLPGTEDNYQRLQEYLAALTRGDVKHPSRRQNAWRRRPVAVPISGIRGEGIDRIPEVVLDLLDS
ncbi:GTP-binding protein-like protein Obg [Eremomyces bilateralis CBS 781.70]|uniref:GTP-binding protein-like protein Obg n=1 Tax=Eremomyces bilateralis CBS 781.70 TaxID=1392243 RepID=A0A6G1G7N7_9PEZI|nr:GTP-binding protein-like protein Obg [Eremomyces bilateralis CBS 781.70]KAF1814022.1 GTP-binding protein-like protein Obg [Eremomyces bilateralis CBS 781.70]